MINKKLILVFLFGLIFGSQLFALKDSSLQEPTKSKVTTLSLLKLMNITKMITGGTLIGLGTALTIVGWLQSMIPQESSVSGAHRLMVHASLVVGIPSTILGLLIFPYEYAYEQNAGI